jgi:hypothetical protein
MRLLLVALLAAISYAQTVSGCSSTTDEVSCNAEDQCYWDTSVDVCKDITREQCAGLAEQKCYANSAGNTVNPCVWKGEEDGCQPAPTTTSLGESTTTTTPCFAADNIVMKENGDRVRIDELQIADRIATRLVDGKYVFSQVSFLKKKFAAPALRFVTETSWVGVSSNHFLTTQNGWELAKDINIEDEIRMASGNWDKVIDIEHYAELMYSVRTTDINQEILVNGLYAMENSDGDEYLHRQVYNFLVFKVLLRSKYLAIFGHHFERLCNGIMFSSVFIAAIFAARQFIGVDSKLFKQE